MHRIDGPGHVNNRFNDGNPATGQEATVVDAAWLNAVQENIITVLAQAGIAPAKGADDQLYLAIVGLIASATAGLGGGGGGGGGVPLDREIDTAGLASGGGTLANDITITVEKASAAEIVAGVQDGKAITPAGLAAAAGAVFGATGYIRLPGGLILQWGVGTALANSTTVITLPTTFPGACLFAGCEGGAQDTDASHNGPFVSGRGVSSISVFNALNASVFVNWFAFGN